MISLLTRLTPNRQYRVQTGQFQSSLSGYFWVSFRIHRYGPFLPFFSLHSLSTMFICAASPEAVAAAGAGGFTGGQVAGIAFAAAVGGALALAIVAGGVGVAVKVVAKRRRLRQGVVNSSSPLVDSSTASEMHTVGQSEVQFPDPSPEGLKSVFSPSVGQQERHGLPRLSVQVMGNTEFAGSLTMRNPQLLGV